MLGAAFKASGMPLLVTIPLKGEYSKRDFDRSARFLGIPYRFPPKFPVSSLAAARAYYWLHGQDCAKAREFAHAVFRAYWTAGATSAKRRWCWTSQAALGLEVGACETAIATPGNQGHG
jgi:2-hydroxychromene-2-carboxylate isomerase